MLEKALPLRQQGLTYKQISNELGVSVDWCKRNLKGITKQKEKDVALEQAVEKATQHGGITRYELIGHLLSHYSKEDVERINISYYKQKMKKLNKRAVVRPEWMDREDPSGSNWYMMELAHCLYEKMDELADLYIEQYPNTNRKSLLYEFKKMLSPNVTKFCQYNEEVALLLSQ